MASVSWTPFCGVDGSSHEHLIYCHRCHARNPQVSYTSSNPVRSSEVIEVSDSPPRTQAPTSILTTSQLGPRFADYNRTQGAEALRQSQTLRQSSSVRSGGRQKLLSKSTVFRAVVTFYFLQYEMSEEGLAHVISCKAIRMFSQILMSFYY